MVVEAESSKIIYRNKFDYRSFRQSIIITWPEVREKNKSIHLIVQLPSLSAFMGLSRKRPIHNTIDEGIAETDLFCGNFCIETKILNLIGCVLCLTATADITQTSQVQELHMCSAAKWPQKIIVVQVD